MLDRYLCHIVIKRIETAGLLAGIGMIWRKQAAKSAVYTKNMFMYVYQR